MPDAGDLTDPIAYSGVWLAVAILLPLLVVGWYAGAWWLTRDNASSPLPEWWRLRVARRRHLRQLNRIGAARRRGVLSSRDAHLAVSATVRSFVTDVTDVDARTMNLEQLRTSGPPEVAGVVERVYPPAFGPREATDEEFPVVLDDARQLVSGWRG